MTGSYLKSSIGKKQCMAVTGLVWCGFVLVHMLGNLLYLLGPAAYNEYGHRLTDNKEIYYALELGLLLTFTLHMMFAAMVVLDNKRSRPIGYAVSPNRGTKTKASLASRTMAYSGVLILVFLVLHLIEFRFGEEIAYHYKNEDIRDLYVLMKNLFSQGLYVVWYVFALGVLGLHLSHALWSACQTLGIIPAGRENKFQCVSRAFGVIVAVGFAINPLYIFFVQSRG